MATSGQFQLADFLRSLSADGFEPGSAKPESGTSKTANVKIDDVSPPEAAAPANDKPRTEDGKPQKHRVVARMPSSELFQFRRKRALPHAGGLVGWDNAFYPRKNCQAKNSLLKSKLLGDLKANIRREWGSADGFPVNCTGKCAPDNKAPVEFPGLV